MWLPLLLACAPVSAPERLLDPDPSIADPAPYGERGPFGAALVRARAQARVSDVVPFDVIYPADADQRAAVQGAPRAGLNHGGRVAPQRDPWGAVHLASRGWATVLPEADLHLAITGPADGEIAYDRLLALSDRPTDLEGLAGNVAVAMGHSLGGVLAARQYARDPRVGGLVLLASFPADGTPVEDGDGTVCEAIVRLRPHVFGNGGGTSKRRTPERQLCHQLGIACVWGLGGGELDQYSNQVLEALRAGPW